MALNVGSAARAYRDARIKRLYEGTNEINRLLISRRLLRRAARGRLALLDAAHRAAEVLARAATGTIAAGADGGDSSGQAGLLDRMRTVVLACLGRAAECLGPALDDQQEILAWLSDLITGVFAVESAVLRAEQGAESPGGSLMAQIAHHALADTVPRLEGLATQILAAVEEGSQVARDLAGIRRLLEIVPPNTLAARRAIADSILETGGYSLGLPTA